MSYHFSPATDSDQLQAALSALYGEQAMADQLARYQKALAGLEAAFGSYSQAALFSAPGRTEIGGNHTDHQRGRVLAGSVNLDVIAAVAPSGDRTIRIQSEGFPMDVVDLDDLSVREEERNTSTAIIRGIGGAYQISLCIIVVEDGTTVFIVTGPFPNVELTYRAALHQSLDIGSSIAAYVWIAIITVVHRISIIG